MKGRVLGRLYSHRRQPMGRFSNVILGTRSFNEGNIEGHRGTTIFYRGSLLKLPCSRDMTIFPIGNKWITLRVHVCKVCLIACILVLIRVMYLSISCLSIHTLIITFTFESDKLRKCKVIRYYNILGMGVHIYELGLQIKLNPKLLLQPYWNVQCKREKRTCLENGFFVLMN